MTAFWRRRPYPTLPSDHGLLPLAGEQELPLREQILRFRELVSSDMDWTAVRRRRFKSNAAGIKVSTLVLTAASTVVLGINGIPARATIALPMVALVSVLSALDAYFSWRSRWILMEEAQYRLQRLRDRMDFYVVTTPELKVERAALAEFFEEQQTIWADVSKRWVEYRKAEKAPEAGSAGEPE